MPAPQPVHVGRQAVYGRAGTVTGYELLFRVDAAAADASERGAYATSQVLITAFSDIGIGTIAGDRRCFVNLTREFLVGDLPLPFDADGDLLRRSPAEVAARLPHHAEVTEALTTGAGPLGDLLSLVHAYEASDLPALINPPPQAM